MARARRRVVRVAVVALAAVVAVAGARAALTARCFALAGPLVCRAESSERRVALSFDDGPSFAGVEAVLPVLEAHGAHATFFLIGSEVEARPDLARRIAAAGHEIGNHSWSHGHMAGFDTEAALVELARTDEAIVAAGAPKPRWMRPPYGMKGVGLGKAVAANGQTMVTWDVEEPSATLGPEAYAEALVDQVRPGSIILIHPMVRSRDVERAALPLVLEKLGAKGYEVVSVGELLDH